MSTQTFRGQIVEVGNLEVGGQGMVVEIKGQMQTFLLDGQGTREAARCLYEFVTVIIEFPEHS